MRKGEKTRIQQFDDKDIVKSMMKVIDFLTREIGKIEAKSPIQKFMRHNNALRFVV